MEALAFNFDGARALSPIAMTTNFAASLEGHLDTDFPTEAIVWSLLVGSTHACKTNKIVKLVYKASCI